MARKGKTASAVLAKRFFCIGKSDTLRGLNTLEIKKSPKKSNNPFT